jgi:hypothetical protein
VNAFYPNHNNIDRYSLVAPVNFVNLQTGEVGFTLTQHVVTLNGEEEDRAFDIPVNPAPIRCGEVHPPVLPVTTTTTIELAGVTYDGDASGTGTINIVNVTTDPAGIHRADYALVELNAETNLGDLGVITTSINHARPVPLSFIEGIEPGTDFPAIETLVFYARATLDGVEYESRTPVTLRSTNVNAFYPNHNGEDQFDLVAPVDFVNAQTGELGFRLIRHQVAFAPAVGP